MNSIYSSAATKSSSEPQRSPVKWTIDELIGRIDDLRPWLRIMQPDAERQRRVPQETVERLDAAGAYCVATPARLGGADFSTTELFRVYESLGRGCGATAWTLWASTGGNMWSAAFPDHVIAPIFETPWVGNRTCAVGGSTRRLSGTARPVDGGWMVKGTWPFATGSVHASHAYLAVYLDDSDDSRTGMVLLPKEDYVLQDDWDTMGLAATGSCTIVVADELFVPEERFSTPQVLMERLAELKQSGFGPRPGGLARSVMVGTGNAVGMAAHALELFLDSIAKKPIAYSPYARQQDAPVTHLNVGTVQMQIKAARAVAMAALDDLDRLHEAGEDATLAEMVRYHADAAFVWDSCATAIETLFRVSGASGIAKTQPLQLVARNCRAGSMHAAHNIQTCIENYGRQLCGVQNEVTSVNVLERAR